MRIVSYFLPFLFLYISSTQGFPRCQNPVPRDLPKITDCNHIIRDIHQQAEESGNPHFTASRRHTANMNLPNLYWDHIPKSTCAIYIDMIESQAESTDTLTLRDVITAIDDIIVVCSFPDHGWQLNEGWDIIGNHKWINVSIERLHWDTKPSGGRANLTVAWLGQENGTNVQ